MVDNYKWKVPSWRTQYPRQTEIVKIVKAVVVAESNSETVWNVQKRHDFRGSRPQQALTKAFRTCTYN